MRGLLKCLIYFLLLFFNINSLFAVDKDSLTYKNDNEKFNVLISTAKKEINQNPKKAVYKLLDAYSISRKKNDLEKQIKAIKLIALGYQNQLKYKQALKYYYISRDLADNLNNNKERIYAYNNIGYIYSVLNDTVSALKYFKKALEYDKYSVDKSIFSITYSNIAELYKNKGEIEQAVKYFNKSYELDKKYNNKKRLISDLNNLGVLYYNLNKLDLAIKYFKECIDSAKSNDDTKNYVFAKINIVDIELKERSNFSQYVLKDLLDIKTLIFKNNIYDLYYPIYELLVYYYKNTGDYKKALKYTDKLTTFKDSLNNIDNLNSVNELKIKYETEHRETENKLLKQNLKIQEIKYKKERNFKIFLITIIILFILLFIFIYLKIKSKIKNSKELEIKSQEISRINDAYLKLNKSLEQKIKESNKELQQKVDKLKKTESELLILLSNYREANKVKETFLNNISNDIRTPLNSINGLAEMLNLKFSEGNCEQVGVFTNGIKQSVSQLLYIFNNFIDHAKINYDNIEITPISCDINIVIQRITEIYQFRINKKNIQLNFDFKTDEKVIVDKILISKVITDILDNSIKYTDKGEINISTELINNESEVLIKISDTGKGISNDILPHIFDDVDLGKVGIKNYDGAGLGLKVVKKYIDLMDGRIEISSKVGKGTTLKIYFKSVKKYGKNKSVSVNKKTLVSNEELKKHDYQILIVEDDAFNQLFLGSLIDEIASSEIVANAEQALELIAKKSKDDLGFDLIFMDINLPGKWDGISLMKEIKKRWSDYNKVIFIAQTAYTEEFDKDRIKEAGFDDYISKPIDTKELINKIKIHLLS